jgi:hypothetical protein
MKLKAGDYIEVTSFLYHDEFIGMRGYISRVDSKDYLVTLENGHDQGMKAFVGFDNVKLVEPKKEVAAMKHRVGTRVQIVNHTESPDVNGKLGYIQTIGTAAYGVKIDNEELLISCYDNELKLQEKKLTSPMEAYGRILLPLLHSSMDAPKTVYYSSTTGAVYMMDKMMDNALYFDVCVVKMLWDRELQDRSPNTLATEVFRLKQPRDMSAVLDAFKQFLMAHINGKTADYADLLWKED